MEHVKQLSETIAQIFQPLTPEIPLYLHVVRGDDNAAIIDGGLPNSADHINKLLAQSHVGKAGKPLQFLLNTHAHHDHIGNFPRLKRDHGALVVTAEKAVPWIEDVERNLREFALHHPHIIPDTPQLRAELEPTYSEGVAVDITLTEGAMVRLGGGVNLEAISLPGHLEAELGWFEHHSNMLILGDAVIGTDWPIFHGHARPAALRASLQKIRAFVINRKVERVAMSHYAHRDADAFVELTNRIVDFVDRVEQTVLECVGATPVDLRAVWQRTCQAMNKEPEFRSLAMVVSHLDEMIDQGLISRVGPELYQRVA